MCAESNLDVAARAERLTREVLGQVQRARDPRVRVLMEALVEHLHAFVRVVQLREDEWLAGIEFLTEAGRVCIDKRQEFILLSDTLGVSMLVDLINRPGAATSTESTVLGPFYVPDAPLLPLGASIAAEDTPGMPCVFRGSVSSTDGSAIPGALVEVWQSDGEGNYDVQKGGSSNLRARFQGTVEGAFWFRCIRPVSYPIPCDGPVGRMMAASDRSPVRPAHLHFKIAAPGFETLVTHLFVQGDEHIASDPVFGVKESLIVDFGAADSGTAEARYDFVLRADMMPQRRGRAPAER
jgi:hydroxyquinol 1,2-dioxygenase